MLLVSKKLTTSIWYGPPLVLAGNYAWKNRILILRAVNLAGAGFRSFDPARPGNSLTTLETGMGFTLDAKGIVANDPSTFFSIDNGEAPAPANLNPDEYEIQASPTDPLVMNSWESLLY
nr:hypothetical protein [Tanacetum cinerariifolium]